ncbi:hypothetical protein FXO38_19125 [Capsicum annuum]|nr:hypothetical protein FXO38_19125 [Capsicum annuum]KAF3649178.1 hypothetical protein FXO37_19079 [Capsicum annuum]
MNIAILLRHSGIWQSEIVYEKCKSDDKELEFDRETEAVLCNEGTESDALALTVVEIQNQYSLYVSEFGVKNFITDCKNTKIKVDQLYKDKPTLVAVMEKYALARGFNTKVK